MLLLALCETWIVTFWQPDLARIDLEWQRVYANILAFPLVVYPVRATASLLPSDLVYLEITIDCGRFNLFILVSPEVAVGTPDMVLWFTRIRLIAFQIILSFHLIALLIFLLIVFSFDMLHQLFFEEDVITLGFLEYDGQNRVQQDEKRVRSNETCY